MLKETKKCALMKRAAESFSHNGNYYNFVTELFIQKII